MERDKGLKLIEAICEGNDEEIDDLLKNRVDLDVIQNGDAAVHMAGRKGMLSVIKRLRRKGDNIGKENLNGHTAAHHAAEGGFLDVIKYLGECGVDLNAKNKEEDTPLHRAVVHQTMDVIEELVDIGMNPNARNKYGRTPVHTCAQNNRIEAMEALIISGAYPALLDKDKNKPEMLATSETMTDQLRMYEVMTAAFRAGCKVGSAFASQYGSRLIKAKCMRITHKFASTPQTIDRVGIIVEKLTIPKEFTSALYCRREKRENTTVTFTIADNEEVISDVFHIRISDSKKNVDARIYLPLYEAPSKTEQMVLLFIEPAVEKVLIDECEARNGTNFCPLQTTLVPDITCVCVVCVRPKVEHNEVDVSGRIITSAIEDEFSLEIPSGAFDENTVVTLQVFEASRDEVTSSEDADDTVNGAEVAASTPSIGESIGGASPTYSTMSTAGFLLTDAYQINLSGQFSMPQLSDRAVSHNATD